jgi:hypothetical protein
MPNLIEMKRGRPMKPLERKVVDQVKQYGTSGLGKTKFFDRYRVTPKLVTKVVDKLSYYSTERKVNRNERYTKLARDAHVKYSTVYDRLNGSIETLKNYEKELTNNNTKKSKFGELEIRMKALGDKAGKLPAEELRNEYSKLYSEYRQAGITLPVYDQSSWSDFFTGKDNFNKLTEAVLKKADNSLKSLRKSTEILKNIEDIKQTIDLNEAELTNTQQNLDRLNEKISKISKSTIAKEIKYGNKAAEKTKWWTLMKNRKIRRARIISEILSNTNISTMNQLMRRLTEMGIAPSSYTYKKAVLMFRSKMLGKINEAIQSDIDSKSSIISEGADARNKLAQLGDKYKIENLGKKTDPVELKNSQAAVYSLKGQSLINYFNKPENTKLLFENYKDPGKKFEDFMKELKDAIKTNPNITFDDIIKLAGNKLTDTDPDHVDFLNNFENVVNSIKFRDELYEDMTKTLKNTGDLSESEIKRRTAIIEHEKSLDNELIRKTNLNAIIESESNNSNTSFYKSIKALIPPVKFPTNVLLLKGTAINLIKKLREVG